MNDSTHSSASRLIWLETGLRVLSERGHKGLTVAHLCQCTGLTKGSFYHHFLNFGAYKNALLDFWKQDYTRDLFAEVQEAEDPEARYELLITLAFEKDIPADLAVRAWAQADAEVRKVLQEVDEERIALLTRMYQDAAGLSKEAARNYAIIDYAGYIGFYSLYPDASLDWARDLASLHTRALLRDSKDNGGSL